MQSQRGEIGEIGEIGLEHTIERKRGEAIALQAEYDDESDLEVFA